MARPQPLEISVFPTELGWMAMIASDVTVRQLVKHCRAIRYGETRGYGQLAARTVGNTMAANRLAIIVPRHRVINADGSAGNDGAPGGRQTKRRLLEMERQTAALVATRPPAGRRPSRLAGVSLHCCRPSVERW